MRTIAHLLPAYNPFPPVYPAGTELRVEQVARRQKRYRPVVICAQFPGQMPAETSGVMAIRRIRIGRVYRRVFQKLTRLDPLPYTTRMWRIASEERAALLHVHNEPKLLTGIRASAVRAGIPLVAHVANEKPIEPAGRECVACWVAASRYISDWLTGANGIAAEKVRVIHTGVDVSAYSPVWDVAPQRRSELRARFGVRDSESVVVLFAGRLVKEKGVQELLDAFERLRANSGRAVELLVAGNVRDSNDPRNEKAVYGRAAVERMRGMAGVTYAGSLHPAEMRKFFLAGDVFALPSLWNDPFPTSMVEAAAAGLPIVAASRGGVTEFLEGSPGFAFVSRPEDANELAAALARYVDSASDRATAGRWLRERVVQHFDWQRVTDDLESLYDDVLGGIPA